MRRILVILSFATLFASIKFPEYSISQLNDRDFVKAEIAKYQAVRDKLQADIESAPPVLRVTLAEDIKKTDCLLEALRYVESRGLKLDDPGLGKLSFFQKVPVGSTILLPKPQVRTTARISTSKAGSSTSGSTSATTAASAEEVVEPGVASDQLPAGVSHGEEIDVKDHMVRGQTTVFDFYSQYCPPCRAVSPLLEELDRRRPDLTVVKVDINRPGYVGIDWQSPVARQFEIQSVPHFKVYAPDGTLQAEGPAGYAVMALLLEEAGIGPTP
ncbi:MAG: TlpA family protein disulfide reductase [Acidobacteriota bacterium]